MFKVSFRDIDGNCVMMAMMTIMVIGDGCVDNQCDDEKNTSDVVVYCGDDYCVVCCVVCCCVDEDYGDDDNDDATQV